MKGFRYTLLLIALLMVPFAIKAQEPSLSDRVSAATVAIYYGEQVCKYSDVMTFFGPMPVWGCKFETHMTCTGTVVVTDGQGGYVGLTAGHCFDWEKIGDGTEPKGYFVSEGTSENPVLRHIVLQKFEFDERYDFAVFTFESHRTYPVVEIDTDSDGPAVGDDVINVNFALGLGKQFNEGKVVSGLLNSPSNPEVTFGKNRFLANLRIGPGASGSAVVSKRSGKIIGLVEGEYRGVSMPATVMATGKTFADFAEDDSAGLKPQKEPAGPPTPSAATPPQPSPLNKIKSALSDVWDSIVEWFLAN